jgi:phage terminase small subunit
MLTPKQETFAKNIVLEEMNQADAYRAAYNAENMADDTIYTEASLLCSNPKVAKRMQELRDSLAADDILSAKDRLRWLSGVVMDETESTKNRLSASDQMNKMQGEYVTKVEGNLNVAKLEELI